MSDLTLINSKTMSIADIDTAQVGTYEVIGSRTGDIKYAKQGSRWLRVLDANAANLPPLAERNFTVVSEINNKTPQMTVKRYDQVSSAFTKKEVSKLNDNLTNHGLKVDFSEHLNQITLKKPLNVKLSLNQKPAVNYQIELEKQPMTDQEKVEVIKLKTNKLGEVLLPIQAVGQYVLTITSPEQKENKQPETETYRSIVSFYVNP